MLLPAHTCNQTCGDQRVRCRKASWCWCVLPSCLDLVCQHRLALV